MKSAQAQESYPTSQLISTDFHLAPPLSQLDPALLLTEKQAAPPLGVKIRTLQEWRMTGRGPAFVRLSARAIRYRVGDLLAFMEARVKSSTAQA